MEKFYDDLIIINLYLQQVCWTINIKNNSTHWREILNSKSFGSILWWKWQYLQKVGYLYWLIMHKSIHLLFILLFSEDHFWMWFFCHSLIHIIWRFQVFAPSFFVRDQIREFNSPPTDIEICYTPPRWSEISEKNWSTKS